MDNNKDLCEVRFDVEGLTCATCALKIEDELKNKLGSEDVRVNFATQKISFSTTKDNTTGLLERVQKISENIENGIIIKPEDSEFVSEIGGYQANQTQIGADNAKSKGFGSFIENENITTGIKIYFGVILAAIAFFVGENEEYFLISLALYIIAYIIAGGRILLGAIKDILNGKLFDEKFLMSVATIGAFAIGEYPEAVAVMVFYRIGEAFQNGAVNSSRKKIKELLKIKPEYANLLDGENLVKVSPETVKKGDFVIIKPGERVPLDGKIVKGKTSFDNSSLTGESLPVFLEEGGIVLSGSINIESTITVLVEKEYKESMVSKILNLIENASDKKAKTENFITKFAKVYTPVVVGLAVSISVLPPLLFQGQSFSDWIYRGLLFLVISCPCALVISIPLGFFGGIAGASANGILVKGGNYLEVLSKADTIVFDKTGTLTKGEFAVSKITSARGFSREQVLETAAIAEYNSNHPIAKSIVKEYEKFGKNNISIKDIHLTESLGSGILADYNGTKIIVGTRKFIRGSGILISETHEDFYISDNFDVSKVSKEINNPDSVATSDELNTSGNEGDSVLSKNSNGNIVYVARDNQFVGYIEIEDELKEDVKESLQELKALKIKKIIMLTGDKKETADRVASILGIDEVYANLLPDDKMRIYEKIKNAGKKGKAVLFVGDGINDAPVLTRADAGIAMGGIGSDAAIESADVVIMDDKISKIAKAIRISDRTKKIVWQNIIIALGVKVAVMVLGAFGLASIWEAVFADVGVAVIAVLNSIRALRM